MSMSNAHYRCWGINREFRKVSISLLRLSLLAMGGYFPATAFQLRLNHLKIILRKCSTSDLAEAPTQQPRDQMFHNNAQRVADNNF